MQSSLKLGIRETTVGKARISKCGRDRFGLARHRSEDSPTFGEE